jgi:hypothetical protein
MVKMELWPERVERLPMSTIAAPVEAKAPTETTAPYRFDSNQFDRMIDAGVFGEDDVELLGGIIYPIMTESERH